MISYRRRICRTRSASRSPAATASAPRSEGPGQDGRGLPLLGPQITVAAAHGQPVGLADGGLGHDLDGDVQVLDHPADEELLLIILLAEDREVGADDLEEGQDHGRDAPEMARPDRPLEHVREPGHLDERGGAAARVNDLLGGREDQVGPRPGAFLEVVAEGPGVACRGLPPARTGWG